MEIKNIIYRKLSELTLKKFNDESLISDIEIDSLDLVELVTEAEEEFEISISDDELNKIDTVGKIIKVIKSAIKNK